MPRHSSPNSPGVKFFEYKDREFELDVVRAYNDSLSDWAKGQRPLFPADRHALPERAGGEPARSSALHPGGHRGMNRLGGCRRRLPHLGDPYGYPVRDICQALGLPVHFHGSAV